MKKEEKPLRVFPETISAPRPVRTPPKDMDGQTEHARMPEPKLFDNPRRMKP